jgi:hypothetical protein
VSDHRPGGATTRGVPDGAARGGEAGAGGVASADRSLSLPALAAKLAELEDLIGGLAYGVQSETGALREELGGRLAVLEQAAADPAAPGDEPEPRLGGRRRRRRLATAGRLGRLAHPHP